MLKNFLIPICGLLWALGGFRWKGLRKIGIPLCNALILRSFSPLLGLLALRVGYGVNEGKGEKSSFLGTFFLKRFNFFWANLFTRFIVGVLYGLSTILYYRDTRVLYAIFITTTITVLFGAIITKEPIIQIGKIQLNTEEIIIGCAYGASFSL